MMEEKISKQTYKIEDRYEIFWHALARGKGILVPFGEVLEEDEFTYWYIDEGYEKENIKFLSLVEKAELCLFLCQIFFFCLYSLLPYGCFDISLDHVRRVKSQEEGKWEWRYKLIFRDEKTEGAFENLKDAIKEILKDENVISTLSELERIDSASGLRELMNELLKECKCTQSYFRMRTGEF